MTTVSETVLEKTDEFGGFSIEVTGAGFVITYRAHNYGELDGLRVLVPYGTWGFDRGIDLGADHPRYNTNGEAMAAMARREVDLAPEEREVVLLEERIPPAAPPEEAAGDSVPETTERRRRFGRWVARRQVESPISWYTFSLRKDDEALYGKAHDLFATFFLTEGMPSGMALWWTSNQAAVENVFFVEIPAGVNVTESLFFQALRPKACRKPSRVGLSLLVGHLKEAAA